MDKNAERNIVEMVFGGDSSIKIEDSEKPDFVCVAETGIEFGAEVTDFYLSESEARLHHIPNYAKDLLNAKAYRHKDDKQKIRVDKIIYRSSKTGEEREILAIIGEEHTIDDVISRIRSAVKSKTEKIAGYSTDIVDLIIRDVGSRAGFESLEKLIHSIRRTDASDAILDTGFREIYLLTKQKGDWVCVPLRANLFVAEVLKFQRLFKEYHGPSFTTLTIGDYMIELARHLVNRIGVIKFDVPKNNQPRLIFGSVAVGYGENQELKIVDISVNNVTDHEVIDFDSEGDSGLQEFVEAEIGSIFACAPILFPARQPQSRKHL